MASGGDIKNAVLKAVAVAAAEPGPDVAKRIHQRHFQRAMEEVLSAKSVIQQSLFSGEDAAPAEPKMQALQVAEARWCRWRPVSLGLAGVALLAASVALSVVPAGRWRGYHALRVREQHHLEQECGRIGRRTG